MKACKVCISGISRFTLDRPTAVNSKNFSTDESSTFDESTSAAGIVSSDTEIDEMVREATKKKEQRKKRSTTRNATEEMLVFQMEQLNYLKEQDGKFETVLRDTFEQQRKIDSEERQKDREFFHRTSKNI